MKGVFASAKLKMSNYIYFDTLTKGNLPRTKDSKFNIISWYMDYLNDSKKYDTIFHSVPNTELTSIKDYLLTNIESPIVRYSTILETIRFIIWFSKAFFVSFGFLILGRWWYAFFFFEAIKMAHIHFSKTDCLAKQYLFHNSSWIYRPLWTYEAEKKGSEIIFYFYSTNSENFKVGNEYPPLNYGWEAMSWSKYLVWDEYQKDFLLRAGVKDQLIKIVGSIDFHSSDEKVLNIPSGLKISVFDVQPVRDSYYFILGARLEYYRPGICIDFLADILNSSRNSTILHKKKREIGKRAHPKYRKYTIGIKKNSNYFNIESDISARALIQYSDLVISMPFTSTALIAREEGKPSIYYDPSGIVMKDDRAAHGIPIISGKEELAIWLKQIIDSLKDTHDSQKN
jgi:polysaccharide biosynthesis PFTS motif protein